MRSFTKTIFAAVAVATAVPALAGPGGNIQIGRDITIDAEVKGNVTSVALGTDQVTATSEIASVSGNVRVGRDVSIRVRQDGNVTAVALGTNKVCAANRIGTINSDSICPR